MTNTLRAVRNEASFLLTAAGVTTYEFVPPRAVPPAAVIEAGSPYMEQGETFTDFLVRINVVLLASTATNEEATNELDQLLCDAIDALETFDVEAVDQPSTFDMNGNQYLGVRIRLVCNKDLTT